MPWPASQQPQLLLATCGGGPVTPPLKMLHARPHMGGRGLPVPASPRIQHPGMGSEPAASFLPSPSSEARGSAVGVCLCSLRLACGSARMEGLSWAELHTSACSMVAGAVTDTDFRHRTTAGAQQIFGKSGGSERRVQVPASYFPSETVMLDGASRPGAPAAAPGERVPPVSTRTRCGWVCDISVGKAEARLFQERVPPPTPLNGFSHGTLTGQPFSFGQVLSPTVSPPRLLYLCPRLPASTRSSIPVSEAKLGLSWA